MPFSVHGVRPPASHACDGRSRRTTAWDSRSQRAGNHCRKRAQRCAARISVAGALSVLALLAAGCYSPHIEIPHAPPKPVDVERRAFLQHDPFTDSWLGPDTETRPREFDRPRTPTRRDLEVRELYARPQNQGRRTGPAQRSSSVLPRRIVQP